MQQQSESKRRAAYQFQLAAAPLMRQLIGKEEQVKQLPPSKHYLAKVEYHECGIIVVFEHFDRNQRADFVYHYHTDSVSPIELFTRTGHIKPGMEKRLPSWFSHLAEFVGSLTEVPENTDPYFDGGSVRFVDSSMRQSFGTVRHEPVMLPASAFSRKGDLE